MIKGIEKRAERYTERETISMAIKSRRSKKTLDLTFCSCFRSERPPPPPQSPLPLEAAMTRRAAHFFLKVFISNKHAYAQMIESSSGRVLASASTMEKANKNSATTATSSTSTSTSTTPVASNSVASCAEAGVRLAQRAAAAGISSDHVGAAWRRAHGQRYHGRVASLLGAARGAGLRLL